MGGDRGQPIKASASCFQCLVSLSWWISSHDHPYCKSQFLRWAILFKTYSSIFTEVFKIGLTVEGSNTDRIPNTYDIRIFCKSSFNGSIFKWSLYVYGLAWPFEKMNQNIGIPNGSQFGPLFGFRSNQAKHFHFLSLLLTFAVERLQIMYIFYCFLIFMLFCIYIYKVMLYVAVL